MNKEQFLQVLRQIFKNARVADVDDIIEVYEDHFLAGYERGLNDAEIIKSLGTPEEIYASYVDAGLITESNAETGDKKVNMQVVYERLEDYKERLLPQLPGMARNAARTLLSIGGGLSIAAGIFVFICIPAVMYLLSISWQPFENVTALPAISMVTLITIFGMGLFGGLTCIFIGFELQAVRKRYFNKEQ